MAHTIRSTKAVEQALLDLFLDMGDDTLEDEMRGAKSFDDAGIITSDRGLVLRFASGLEVQVTIVASAVPDGGWDEDDDEA